MCDEVPNKGQTLYNAAAWGELEKVEFLLFCCNKDEINWLNPEGKTPLYIASAWGLGNYEEIAKLLLDHGADVNLYNYKANSPLYVAASWGHVEVVSLLIRNNAHINMQMEMGRTPLHVAAICRTIAIGRKQRDYEKHLQYNIYDNAKMCMEKIMKSEELVQFFTASIFAKHYKLLTSFDVSTVKNIPDDILDIILHYRHFMTVVELVQGKADINLQDDEHETALDKAYYSEHSPMIKYLIKHGAIRGDKEN